MSIMIQKRSNDGRELFANYVIVSSSDRGAMMFTPSDRATRNFISKAQHFPFIAEDVADEFAMMDWEKGAKNMTLF